MDVEWKTGLVSMLKESGTKQFTLRLIRRSSPNKGDRLETLFMSASIYSALCCVIAAVAPLCPQ